MNEPMKKNFRYYTPLLAIIIPIVLFTFGLYFMMSNISETEYFDLGDEPVPAIYITAGKKQIYNYKQNVHNEYETIILSYRELSNDEIKEYIEYLVTDGYKLESEDYDEGFAYLTKETSAGIIGIQVNNQPSAMIKYHISK